MFNHKQKKETIMKMKQMKLLGAVAAMSLLFACGDAEEVSLVGGAFEADNKIKLCKATFLEDQTINDFFGDYSFEVSEGDRFVLGDARGRIKMVRETNLGAHLFEFRGDPDAFTSSCEEKETKAMLAVFADVTVFEDEEMTTELCRLKKGDLAEIGGSWSQSAVSSSYGEENVYNVSLNGFKEQCGGESYGFVLTKRLGMMNKYMPLLKVKAEHGTSGQPLQGHWDPDSMDCTTSPGTCIGDI